MKKFIIVFLTLIASINCYAEEPLWEGRYRESGRGYWVEGGQYAPSPMPDRIVTVRVYDDCITVDDQVFEYKRSIGRGTKVYYSSWSSTSYYVRSDRSMYMEYEGGYPGMTMRYSMEPVDE